MGMHSPPSCTDQYILEHFDETLEKNYIRVFLQPVIRTLSEQVCSMEALARWEDPVFGLLPPAAFIPVLERHRLIHRLDSFVVDTVCRKMAEDRDYGLLPVSINLSRLDYELCDIFEIIEQSVRRYKVNRNFLCIEITESALNENQELLRSYIQRFRAAGYQVWMDDFGSGYSSLNVLKDYEFDELKIDMKFLSDFHARSKKILASIVHMAKEIGIQTLAEGVETEEQYEFLKNIGCEKVQGYLFGKPMPFDECTASLKMQWVGWETPTERLFYDELGRINFLSATPFSSHTSGRDPGDGRRMNSIPLALLKIKDDELQILCTNEAFDQTARDVSWGKNIIYHKQFHHNKAIPLSSLYRDLSDLLEEAKRSGRGKRYFVSNNEYYEVTAKLYAQHRGSWGILMTIDNLSRRAEMERQRQMEDGLLSLYSVYEQVTVLDVERNLVIHLNIDSEETWIKTNTQVEAYLKEYKTRWIFPYDRERFENFFSIDTLEDRISATGRNTIILHFRRLSTHGSYRWKCFQLLRIRKGEYYLLVRDAAGEILDLEKEVLRKYRSDTELEVTPSTLWDTAVNHSHLKFFWKDRNRRFLGASREFMEYYGFRSLTDILGKTDEDMGWHLHPDRYRNCELDVLEEGIPSAEVVGKCISQGENRDIMASKIPIYNRQGAIIGLMGYFHEVKEKEPLKAETDARTDILTGLLNTRGLNEELDAYLDEYKRREQDFMRLEILIDNLPEINLEFGYDFGDRVIWYAGQLIREASRNAATVGRSAGSSFILLQQVNDASEMETVVREFSALSEKTYNIDGILIDLYLSLRSMLYSEANPEDFIII